ARLAAGHDAALILESGRANGAIVSSRKGTTDYVIRVRGRAAHAGVEPDEGRSAVIEAAHKAIEIADIHGRWPGVTCNVGILRGGTRSNVVAEEAVLEVDLRAPELATLEEAKRAIEAVCARPGMNGVTISVRGDGTHAPMEKTRASQRLVDEAVAVAGELGFELRDSATGGASDGNTTSATGCPTLDGLGPVGGAAHSRDEWLDLESVVPRIALLAGVITRYERGRGLALRRAAPGRLPDARRGGPGDPLHLSAGPVVDEPLHEPTDRVLARVLRGGVDGGPRTVEGSDPPRRPGPSPARERGIQPQRRALRRRVPHHHEGRADRVDPRRSRAGPRARWHAPVLARRDAGRHRAHGGRGEAPVEPRCAPPNAAATSRAGPTVAERPGVGTPTDRGGPPGRSDPGDERRRHAPADARRVPRLGHAGSDRGDRVGGPCSDRATALDAVRTPSGRPRSRGARSCTPRLPRAEGEGERLGRRGRRRDDAGTGSGHAGPPVQDRAGSGRQCGEARE